MLSYLILTLLGICTSLQANGGIPILTKWLQLAAFLPVRGDKLLLLTGIFALLLLILAILIEYGVFIKMIKNAPRKQTLYALIAANITSGILGGIPLLILIIKFARFLPEPLLRSLDNTVFKWAGNIDPKNFINDPMQVISWLAFYLMVNLIIEAPIIKSSLRQISFKQIAFVTLIANLASNIAFLVLLKVATLIWS